MSFTRQQILLAGLIGIVIDGSPLFAGEALPQRPTIGLFRWQEDWSVLAQGNLPGQPGDALKYIRLSPEDGGRYLSLGATLRERFEHSDAPLFGSAARAGDNYLLHRLELHLDAHLTDRTRIFLQLENALAPGRALPSAADANKADLRLAFLDTSGALWGGEYELRIGRQEVAFDLQRFASVREGANVRQAFDALRIEYQRDNWLLAAFASQPVQYRNDSAFDDRSSRHFMFGGVRAKRVLSGGGNMSVTLSEYRRQGARLLAGSGSERRHNLDVHYGGVASGFDWDIEGLYQRGSIGDEPIRAWGAGSLAGYTFDAVAWRPRVGAQLDAASGDRDLSDTEVGTFNPMFPNGYYVTLSGYTGYANFVHLKPSLTLAPARQVRVLMALGMLWRETTGDAVYAQPLVPIPGTAGTGGKRSASYYQLRVDWTVTRNFALALEANRYEVASAIRNAGGRDATYLGVEARWGW